jgi:thiamine biosynthesis lipoprotein
MKHNVVVLFLTAVLGGAASAADPLRIEGSLDAMGTAYTLVLYDEDRQRLETALEDAFEEVRRLDALLSNYRQNSEWSKANRLAATQPVVLSAELFSLLSACQEYSALSEGAFDITVGPLMKVWGFYKGSGRLPHRAEVRTALRNVGYRNLELNPAESTLRFRRPGVEMDPGGIGKGYAVDRVVKVLQDHGIRSALVSAGGSTIFGLGHPPHDAAWKIAIRDPKNKRLTVEQLELRDQSMSTSGTYEKFFRAEGRTFSHIMDPRTGWPAEGMLSVSVVAPRAIDSEAWTKPVFINGRRWAASHLPAGFRALVCEDASPRRQFAQSRMEPPCVWLP